jgi:hypothetical protein
MSLTQEQGNQIFRAALIYPFLILVLGFMSITMSDNFLDALPKDENPSSVNPGETDRALTETTSENEPVLVTIPDRIGEEPTPTTSVKERNEAIMQQDESPGDIRTSTRPTDRAETQMTKYPPAVVLGLVIQVVQLYLFHQISSITTDLVRAKNDISFKVICGIGFCVATVMIMASIGKLNSAYASARAGRRAEYEAWEGGLYDIFSVISALVIVYSWGRFAWA